MAFLAFFLKRQISSAHAAPRPPMFWLLRLAAQLAWWYLYLVFCVLVSCSQVSSLRRILTIWLWKRSLRRWKQELVPLVLRRKLCLAFPDLDIHRQQHAKHFQQTQHGHRRANGVFWILQLTAHWSKLFRLLHHVILELSKIKRGARQLPPNGGDLISSNYLYISNLLK